MEKIRCHTSARKGFQRLCREMPSQAQAQVIYANVKEEEPSSSSGWTNDDSTGRDDPYGNITVSRLLAVAQSNKNSPEKREGTEVSVSPFSPIGIREPLRVSQGVSGSASVQMSVAPVVMSRSDHWEVRGNVLIRHRR